MPPLPLCDRFYEKPIPDDVDDKYDADYGTIERVGKLRSKTSKSKPHRRDRWWPNVDPSPSLLPKKVCDRHGDK